MITRDDSISRLELLLIERYGVLLEIDNLAEVLHRQPGGLRWALSQNNDFARLFNSARVRIGRRSYYRASDLAVLLSDNSAHD